MDDTFPGGLRGLRMQSERPLVISDTQVSQEQGRQVERLLFHYLPSRKPLNASVCPVNVPRAVFLASSCGCLSFAASSAQLPGRVAAVGVGDHPLETRLFLSGHHGPRGLGKSPHSAGRASTGRQALSWKGRQRCCFLRAGRASPRRAASRGRPG